MKHFHDNLNHNDDGSSRLTDDQLDQLLSSVQPPAIDRPRKRRLKRHLSRLLHSNVNVFALDANWACVAAGTVAVCGLAFLIITFGKFDLGNEPEMALHSVENTEAVVATPESALPKFSPIVSYVAWTPRRAEPIRTRPQPVSNFLKNRHAQIRATLNEFGDSETGLNLLEQASSILDTQRQLAQSQLDQRSWQRNSNRALVSTLRMRDQLEASLVGDIQSRKTTTAEKIRSFRKLCRCGSTKSQALIFKQWENDQLYRDVAAYARRVSDSRTIGQMAAATNDNELKTELMTELLERDSQESVNLFLKLTQEHQLYSLARQSGKRARWLPTQRLLAALHSNRMSEVRAASITLSQANDPEITNALLELTHNPTTVHAAVLALTARQDEQAHRFVELASNDLQWSATVATAQRKWNRLLAVN